VILFEISIMVVISGHYTIIPADSERASERY
jgi:hypothetical protein